MQFLGTVTRSALLSRERAHGGVYRAFDREVKRDIALKLLHPEEESPNALSRLRREVRVARDAVSPRLVRIFDIATAPEGAYLTMEFVDGPSLREVLKKGPRRSRRRSASRPYSRRARRAPRTRDHAPGREAGKHHPHPEF